MKNWEQRHQCEWLFQQGGPFFIVTSENLPWLLFTDEREFQDGTNMEAVALAGLNLKMLNDVQMNNHVHFLLEGPSGQVQVFVDRYRKAMSRYQIAKGKASLAKWIIRTKEIQSWTYLQYAHLYLSRNPYVARRNITPEGYRWSGAQLMFNQNLCYYAQGTPFNELTYREKRNIVHARDISLPDTYRVLDGTILRQCFIDYRRAESFFESAHRYFYLLSRKVEADAETARWIGEQISLPTEDVFRIVADWYHVKTVNLLLPDQRQEAARRMKAELMCNNKQIAQVLHLPLAQVNAFFPVPE